MTEPSIPQPAGRRVFPAETPQDSIPEFAVDANAIRTIKLDLSTARDEKEIAVAGTVLWAIDASDLEATVTVKFNDQIGSGIDYQKGLMIRGAKFTRLFVTNDAQSGKSITLLYVVEAATNINIENALIGFNNVGIKYPTNYTGSGDQTINDATTDTIASQSDRHEIIIEADKGNTGVLAVRDSGGNKFGELDAGDTIRLPGTDELQIRNDSGAQQTYRHVEARD